MIIFDVEKAIFDWSDNAHKYFIRFPDLKYLKLIIWYLDERTNGYSHILILKNKK